MEITYLTKEQVKDKVNKTIQLSNKEFKEMLAHQYGGNIIAQRQLQTLRNTLLANKNGNGAIATFEKVVFEAKQLREGIKMGNEIFSPAEIGDMLSTLGRHLKRLVRYVEVDQLPTLTQDHLDQYQDLIESSNYNVEEAIAKIKQDRIRQQK